MKYVEYLGGVALVGLLLLPVSSFARDKNEGNLTLSEPSQVGSTVLEPGQYKVEWHGSGPNVNVDFLQRGKTMATTSATLAGYTSGPDQIVASNVGANNQKTTLEEIDFARQKEALRLTPASGK